VCFKLIYELLTDEKLLAEKLKMLPDSHAHKKHLVTGAKGWWS
jgi:hypothetical protein